MSKGFLRQFCIDTIHSRYQRILVHRVKRPVQYLENNCNTFCTQHFNKSIGGHFGYMAAILGTWRPFWVQASTISNQVLDWTYLHLQIDIKLEISRQSCSMVILLSMSKKDGIYIYCKNTTSRSDPPDKRRKGLKHKEKVL